MALICNLVQEFNGLVSKGSTAMLALLLCKKIPPFLPLLFFRHFMFENGIIVDFYNDHAS